MKERITREFVEINDAGGMEVTYRVTFSCDARNYSNITEEIIAYGEIHREEKAV